MPTIGESNDLCALLRWIPRLTDTTGDIEASERAKAAAMRLAERVNKVMGAGPRPEQVAAEWPTPTTPSAD